MDGTETCRLEDLIAQALDAREGALWVRVFLEQCAAGIRPDAQTAREALRDWQRTERFLPAVLAHLRADRGVLPRGRG